MQTGGDDGHDSGPDNESAKRLEAGAGGRKGGLTPVTSHPQDDEWRRISLGLRVLLAGAVAEPLPVEMERALSRLAEAEQGRPQPEQPER